MSALPQQNQSEAPKEVPKENSEETNLVRQRKHYERQIEQERIHRLQMEQELSQIKKSILEKNSSKEEEDLDNDEPYVDHKRLEKKLNKFEQKLEQTIEKKAEEKAKKIMEAERQSQWLKNNPDFYDIMQYAQAFAEKDPELAETILQMPEGFDRQKLVYKNIKALGVHKKEEPKQNIQDKIDQNRRTPYYQPSSVGAAPYAMNGDFSDSGQKNAYQKMQELKKRLRI